MQNRDEQEQAEGTDRTVLAGDDHATHEPQDIGRRSTGRPTSASLPAKRTW